MPSSNIRPVDTSFQALGVKRTSGFMRAFGELARHRELLGRPVPPPASDNSDDDNESPHVATKRRKVNAGVVLQLVDF